MIENMAADERSSSDVLALVLVVDSRVGRLVIQRLDGKEADAWRRQHALNDKHRHHDMAYTAQQSDATATSRYTTQSDGTMFCVSLRNTFID